MQNKVALRAHYRNLLRNNLVNKNWPEHELRLEELNQALQSYLKKQKGIWAAYSALPDEPNPNQAIQASDHIQWVYPSIEGESMRFYGGACVKPNAYGINEPDTKVEDECAVDEVEGFLVPGLAFDQKGARLGRGKGYFDRALKKHQGHKGGVAFEFQISPQELPVEDHDILMNQIITENGARL